MFIIESYRLKFHGFHRAWRNNFFFIFGRFVFADESGFEVKRK